MIKAIYKLKKFEEILEKARKIRENNMSGLNFHSKYGVIPFPEFYIAFIEYLEKKL